MNVHMTPDRPLAYVGQYLAGGFAGGTYYLDGKPSGSTSTSGFRDLETAIAECAERLAEGAYVFDKREVPAAIGIRAVVGGPMGKADLPPMTIETWEETITFESPAAACDSGKIKSSTFVSLDIEAEYWRRLGARIGRWIGGKVVWQP